MKSIDDLKDANACVFHWNQIISGHVSNCKSSECAFCCANVAFAAVDKSREKPVWGGIDDQSMRMVASLVFGHVPAIEERNFVVNIRNELWMSVCDQGQAWCGT